MGSGDRQTDDGKKGKRQPYECVTTAYFHKAPEVVPRLGIDSPFSLDRLAMEWNPGHSSVVYASFSGSDRCDLNPAKRFWWDCRHERCQIVHGNVEHYRAAVDREEYHPGGCGN